MLLGIPVVERLRQFAPDRVEIWPFTTGLTRPQDRAGLVVVAEIWPTLTAFDHVDHPVRDARQVLATTGHLRTCCEDRRLADSFAPVVAQSDRERIVQEEGWVLGVGASDAAPVADEVADLGVTCVGPAAGSGGTALGTVVQRASTKGQAVRTATTNKVGKRILAGVAASVLVLGASACGSDDDTDDPVDVDVESPVDTSMDDPVETMPVDSMLEPVTT